MRRENISVRVVAFHTNSLTEQIEMILLTLFVAVGVARQ